MYEVGHSMRDFDDYFLPWGVSACAIPIAMYMATFKSCSVQDKSCTLRMKSGTVCAILMITSLRGGSVLARPRP